MPKRKPPTKQLPKADADLLAAKQGEAEGVRAALEDGANPRMHLVLSGVERMANFGSLRCKMVALDKTWMSP